MADVFFSEIDKLANSMKTSNRLMNWPVDFEKNSSSKKIWSLETAKTNYPVAWKINGRFTYSHHP